MRSSRYHHFLLLLLVTGSITAGVTYRSPMPGSRFHSRETNIILRCAERHTAAELSGNSLRVTGAVSGPHAGVLSLSDDGMTVLFQPKVPFAAGETVTVEPSGAMVGTEIFSFTITPLREPLSRTLTVAEDGSVHERSTVPLSSPLLSKADADSLPADFPKFTVLTSKNPAPGNFFLTTSDDVAGVGHFFYMVDNTGKVVKYQRRPGHVYDFKVQPNGLMTYADPFSDWVYAGGSRTVHRVIDTNFAAIDSFRAGNGYDADTHEFLMLPNGHVMLHAYDIQYMDLSTVVAGGNVNAIVVGSIVQELDLQKNVVFQWRSWDHVGIAETYMNAQAAAFDYIHVNAYDVDTDGNFLLCFRNTCEIVKVDRATGDFIWRMGGKSNQFTFTGENEGNKPAYFTFQHGFKRLPNGNFILFDNGNLHTPAVSRAVEYRIDQKNKTAALVWQYHHTPEVYAPTRGSVQRLPNGNTVIGWGSASFVGIGKTMITELDPKDSIVFEMESNDKMPSYRAQKFLWNDRVRPAADVVQAELLTGNTYRFDRGDTNRTGVAITMTDAVSGYNAVEVKRYGFAPVNASYPDVAPLVFPGRFIIEQIGFTSFTADITFDSTVVSAAIAAQMPVIYRREFEGSGMFLPLTTTYDAAKRSLTVTTTTLGEFIIGAAQPMKTPPVPAPVLPLMNAKMNQTRPVLIRWKAEGHITGSRLQIAKDSLFTAPVYDDSLLMTSAVRWSGYQPGTKYFWRTKAVNELGSSSWSVVNSFVMSPVFLSVLFPTASAVLTGNSTVTLKYENNIEDRVNIRLYRNGSLVLKIKDSTENTGRFVWKVPNTPTLTYASDSSYVLRISSAVDSTVTGSSAPFSIALITGVRPSDGSPDRFALEQNFPNPFNPTTTIRYSLAAESMVTLQIFDLIGRLITVPVHERKNAGEYAVVFDGAGLPSGMYLCRMDAGSFRFVRKIVLMK